MIITLVGLALEKRFISRLTHYYSCHEYQTRSGAQLARITAAAVKKAHDCTRLLFARVLSIK